MYTSKLGVLYPTQRKKRKRKKLSKYVVPNTNDDFFMPFFLRKVDARGMEKILKKSKFHHLFMFKGYGWIGDEKTMYIDKFSSKLILDYNISNLENRFFLVIDFFLPPHQLFQSAFLFTSMLE